MSAFVAWLRQPSSLIAVAVVMAGVAYWFSGNAMIAVAVFGGIAGGINDHTADLAQGQAVLQRVEGVIDQVKKGAAPALLLGLSLGLSGCGTGPNAVTNMATAQAIVAGVDGAVTAERADILKAVPKANQPAAVAALDGAHAAAVAIAAIDPAKTSRDQAVAAVQAFIDAAQPLVNDLPLSANVKAGIQAALPLLRAFVVLIPEPAPTPSPAPPTPPAPMPAPVVTPPLPVPPVPPVTDAPKVTP